MAANVRYRGTYYNTTGTYSTWIIEILDTESVAGVTNVEITRPNESFEGLTQDLKPGIYPASLTFGMYMRSSPRAKQGITYGASIGILTDIASSPEGRFLARLKKDGVIHFVGPIIYDQCSYTDESIPLLNITAVDGLNRWQTTDYISQVGQLKYYSMTAWLSSYDNTTLTYNGPIVGVSPMTVFEHTVDKMLGVTSLFRAITTFVHREVYSLTSPGSGWVDQGQGLWAKSVPYTNEVETEDVGVKYHLTRDIDDEKHRTISEYISRAIFETKMTGEYASPAVMYDCSSEWYENDMGDVDADPFGQMRLHEDPFLGKPWSDGMQEICRLLNLRIYYSKGRYHFEQISYRDGTTFDRFKYESDGTLIGVETASLDLNFASLDIEPQAGGVYKFLAPLRSVEASISLDNANLLEGVEWKDGDYGQRYVGRIKKTSGTQKMWTVLDVNVTSTFDPTTLALYPQSFLNLICVHTVKLKYSIRITNLNTATTYWLDAIEPHGFRTIGTWEVTESEIEPNNGLTFGTEGYGRYNADNYGYSRHAELAILAETLPGSADDMFDIHISFRAVHEFQSQVGATLWTTIHTNKFWTISNALTNTMRFYSVASLADFTNWEEAETDAELVYTSENDVANSIRVKVPIAWADTAQHEKSIEIYDGTDWKRSEGWSIGGIGTAVPIGKLLVSEIMSLRTVPKNIYSGAFISSLPNSENRFQRGTDYYLPLSCTRDSDMDLFQGEFLQIAKTTPPAVTTINSPIAGGPIPGLTPAVPIDPPIPTLYFETNEAITAASTLTEVDIINTLEVYVANGETVTIVNSTTGESENVTLTQEILPADTVMHFESNVMAYSYPDGSAIVIQDGDVTIESGGSKYRYDNRLYNGSTHTIPTAALDLVALDGLSNQHLNNKVWVFRNGQKLIGVDFTTIGLVGGIYWWYDSGTNQISVHTDFEYVDEWIHIDIDLNR